MSFTGTGKIWMNGTLVDWADAKIHVASHVVHYGSGVFEGARCYSTPRGSACFRLDTHMRRLFDSVQDLPDGAGDEPRERCTDAVLETIRANDFKACYIRPIVYRGYNDARREPVSLPGRHGHPHVGVGRVSRAGRARERRGRAGQLVGAAPQRIPSRRSPRPPRTTRTRS